MNIILVSLSYVLAGMALILSDITLSIVGLMLLTHGVRK